MPRVFPYTPPIKAIQVYSGDAVINPGTMPPSNIRKHVKQHWSQVIEWIVVIPKYSLEFPFSILSLIRERSTAYLSQMEDYYIIALPVQKGTQLRE